MAKNWQIVLFTILSLTISITSCTNSDDNDDSGDNASGNDDDTAQDDDDTVNDDDTIEDDDTADDDDAADDDDISGDDASLDDDDISDDDDDDISDDDDDSTDDDDNMDCENECENESTKQCFDSKTVQVCGNYDDDNCLEWGGDKPCTDNSVCDEGECVDACVPKTCEQLGYDCGEQKDNCGNNISCGNCMKYPNSYCGSGGKCDCELETCSSLDKDCGGPYDDGCGGEIEDCGGCTVYANSYCTAEGQCDCASNDCTSLNKECDGPYDDGCGGEIENCGECTVYVNSYCTVEGQCDCAPNDCTSLSKECGGPYDNGCGSEIEDCGECTAHANSFCNGSGQCDCTPDDCASLSKECGGPYDDSCGGEITSCGTCDIAGQCSNGKCTPYHIWSKAFGGSDSDSISFISQDENGNIYMTGKFKSSTIDFGGGEILNNGLNDIFLAKFDSDGNHIWSKGFGGTHNDECRSISLDSDNSIYIIGEFEYSINFGGEKIDSSGQEDVFLAKFDSDGNHVWSKGFGGDEEDYGYSISIDNNDNIFLTGWFVSNSINFGGGEINNNGEEEIFLVKFDSNGNHIWSKGFGGTEDDYSYSISVDTSNNIYIMGECDGELDFGNGIFDCSYELFLVKLDNNGSYLWFKGFNDAFGSSISLDNNDNIYIIGGFGQSTDFGGSELKTNGGGDIFIAKLDTEGNHIWSKGYGGSNDDSISSITQDENGNVYIIGGFRSGTIDFGGGLISNNGQIDAFIAKLDTEGKHLWSKGFGGNSWDGGTSISIDNNFNVLFGGYFWSNSIDFGGGKLEGYFDLFIVKFGQ